MGQNGVVTGLPIGEAAEVLGISPTAVRKRVKRGTLPAHKGVDGCWYVDIQPTRPPGSPIDQDNLVARLTDEVAFLRAELERRSDELRMEREGRGVEQERRAEELRRKDVLQAELTHRIANLSERLPELPSTTTPSSEQTTRSWWQRLFGTS